MNALIRKLIRSVGLRWLTGKIRDAAEGRLGAKWKAAYWFFAGRKRVISFLFGIVAGTAALAGYPEVATITASIAAVGLALGFVDANWRDTSQTDWLKDSWLWRFLAQNSPAITALLAAALPWFKSAECTLGADYCGYGVIAVTVVGAGLVQIGMVDAAWNAWPPAPPSGTPTK